jgi:hypothetical protein
MSCDVILWVALVKGGGGVPPPLLLFHMEVWKPSQSQMLPFSRGLICAKLTNEVPIRDQKVSILVVMSTDSALRR